MTHHHDIILTPGSLQTPDVTDEVIFMTSLPSLEPGYFIQGYYSN
jgi:hypothetical protein